MIWVLALLLVGCDRGGSSSGYGFEIEDTQAYNRKLQAGYESLSREDREYVTRHARRVKVVEGPIQVDPDYGAGEFSYSGMDTESKTIYIQGEWLAGAEAEAVGELLKHEAGHRYYHEQRHTPGGLDLTPAQEHEALAQ